LISETLLRSMRHVVYLVCVEDDCNIYEVLSGEPTTVIVKYSEDHIHCHDYTLSVIEELFPRIYEMGGGSSKLYSAVNTGCLGPSCLTENMTWIMT
jgi:hypothetical protein